MSDPMAEIRASFFIECEELLESLQDSLELMDSGEADDETVNVMFRAVHSIKGGAGAFGLDELVAFAHKFETVMDMVRNGDLTPDHELVKLFFICGDKLSDLVRQARDGEEYDPAQYADTLAKLDALIGEDEDEEEIDFQPAALSLDLGGDGEGSAPGLPDLPGLPPLGGDDGADGAAATQEPVLRIRFTPETALYASGNEPLYLFRAVRDLGDLTVRCVEETLPPLEELDPEKAFLSWELTLVSGEGEAAVREAFDFVDGLCELTVTEQAPASGDSQPDPAETATPSTDTGGESGAETTAEPPAAPAPSTTAETPPANKAEPAEKPAAATNNKTGKPQAKSAGSKPAGAKKPATAAPRATVRVDLDRIDRLVNLVGEIVINQAMLSQSVEEAGLPPNSPVRTGLDEFLQLTRDIQESVMMIRAQPVKSLFQRMARIVREASAAVGKEVRLITEGENTEIDKTVIERLADPLTHMIRNAVDHGLESAEKRLAAGKSAEGIITLNASHRSGRVVIEVSDDGAGINRERVHQIAIDKGLIDPDLQLSDSDIDNLLFLPGFSTASEVSNLSGRGVGMDVVRSAIQALGGRITIASTAGKGTTFSISLPLTLAVLDGMIVRVAGETLVVPLNVIQETLALGPDDIRPFGPDTHVVNIRNTFVPLLDLGAELGYREPLEDYANSVILLIAQDDGERAAVAVDSIEDQRQVVIKGLQDSYGHVPGIAAATILGDGQIALILDPLDLISEASGCTRPQSSSELKAG